VLPALQGFNANSTSDAALNTLIHELLLSRAQDALDMAQKIATKRSGQRGHTARQDLLAAEAALATLQAQDPQTYVTASMAHELMTQIFGAYEALDVEADEARARSILRGLGFKDEDLLKEGKEIGALSGGWRMRVMLGKALFIKPDILLLDEPSSFFVFLLLLLLLVTYLTYFSQPFGPSCDRLASVVPNGRDGRPNRGCCIARPQFPINIPYAPGALIATLSLYC